FGSGGAALPARGAVINTVVKLHKIKNDIRRDLKIMGIPFVVRGSRLLRYPAPLIPVLRSVVNRYPNDRTQAWRIASPKMQEYRLAKTRGLASLFFFCFSALAARPRLVAAVP